MGLSSLIGSVQPASSRSQRSSTKLKLMVSEIVACGQAATQRVHAPARLRTYAADDGASGAVACRQAGVAEHADDFFDQVFFDLDIEAPARRRHVKDAVLHREGQAEAGEDGRPAPA